MSMSRIGKQPVIIPKDVHVSFKGGVITVKGPKGVLELAVRPDIRFIIKDESVTLVPQNTDEFIVSLWGTYRSHLQNMIKGATKGYEKRLVIEGVGYRANLKGTDLELKLGFSHPIVVKARSGVDFMVEKNTIIVSGISKELVGNVAASIRSLKKPEPYKGKGIKYENEVIRRKVGKRAAGTTM